MNSFLHALLVFLVLDPRNPALNMDPHHTVYELWEGKCKSSEYGLGRMIEFRL